MRRRPAGVGVRFSSGALALVLAVAGAGCVTRNSAREQNSAQTQRDPEQSVDDAVSTPSDDIGAADAERACVEQTRQTASDLFGQLVSAEREMLRVSRQKATGLSGPEAQLLLNQIGDDEQDLSKAESYFASGLFETICHAQQKPGLAEECVGWVVTDDPSEIRRRLRDLPLQADRSSDDMASTSASLGSNPAYEAANSAYRKATARRSLRVDLVALLARCSGLPGPSSAPDPAAAPPVPGGP